jgi:hypothetical protein
VIGMQNYYFLANELPKIEIDSAPVVSFPDLMTLYTENLKKEDLEEVKTLRLYYDIINTGRLLEKELLDFRGNYSENELKEHIASHQGLPSYVFDFLEERASDEERLKSFSELLSMYFKIEGAKKNVASDLLNFEKELALFLVGYRSFKMSKPLDKVLANEDQDSDLVRDLLARKDHSALDATNGGFKELGRALMEAKGEPHLENLAIATFKFNYYTNYQFGHPFSIKYLLPYMMQLIIIEDLYAQNEQLGGLILNSILKDNA